MATLMDPIDPFLSYGYGGKDPLIKWEQGSANILGNDGEFEIYGNDDDQERWILEHDDQFIYLFRSIDNAKAVAEIIKMDLIKEKNERKNKTHISMDRCLNNRGPFLFLYLLARPEVRTNQLFEKFE
jgi:hypothetical protein